MDTEWIAQYVDENSDSPTISVVYDEADSTMWFEMGISQYGEGTMFLDNDAIDGIIAILERAKEFLNSK